MHRIFVGFKREDFGYKVHLWECQTSSRQSVRDSVDSFVQFSTEEDRLLVDVLGWLVEDGYWGIFLKTLEDENCRGEVWFYGGFLVHYPSTIRSRCLVEGKAFDVESDSFKKFLKENDAEQFVADFKELRAYNLVAAWDMLSSKARFLTFMYHLNSTSRENFHLLFAPLTDMRSPCYINLFYEWFQKNPIFSSSELEVCEFLQDGKFEQILPRFLNTSFFVEEYLFPFLITYKMLRAGK